MQGWLDGSRHWLTKYTNMQVEHSQSQYNIATFHSVEAIGGTIINIHGYLCRDGCVKCSNMLWNVLSLFVYFVSQCLHTFSHPYIWQISFRNLFKFLKLEAQLCAYALVGLDDTCSNYCWTHNTIAKTHACKYLESLYWASRHADRATTRQLFVQLTTM